jgi:hypothetical protein
VTVEFYAKLNDVGFTSTAAEMTASMVAYRASLLEASAALKDFNGASLKGGGGAAPRLPRAAPGATRPKPANENGDAGAAAKAAREEAAAVKRRQAGIDNSLKIRAVYEKQVAKEAAQEEKRQQAAKKRRDAGIDNSLKIRANYDKQVARDDSAALKRSDAKAKKDEAATERARKKSEREVKVAVRDEAAAEKRMSAAISTETTRRQKLAEGSRASMVKGATVALAIITTAAAVAGTALTFAAPLALGYRGVAQIQRLTYQAQLNMRRLFVGVDSRPVVRAYDKLLQILNPRGFMGGVLSGIFTRTFNGLFSLLEKAQPYVTAFAEGAVYGFLVVENAVLKARIAILPFSTALEDLIGDQEGLDVAFKVGAVAIGFLATGAALAASAFVALSEAFLLAWKAWGKVKDFGAGVIDAAVSLVVSDATRQKDDGKASGTAFADGVIAGMKSKEAAVKAGGVALGKAPVAGFNEANQIKSPSRLMRRQARFLGAGAEQGIQDSAAGVQRAAERALVPQLPQGGAGSSGGGGAAPIQIGPFYFGDIGAGADVGAIERACEDAIRRSVENIAIALGRPVRA